MFSSYALPDLDLGFGVGEIAQLDFAQRDLQVFGDLSREPGMRSAGEEAYFVVFVRVDF